MNKCIVCQSTDLKKLYPQLCRTKNYICVSCGLVQIADRRSIDRDYYKNDGYSKKFHFMSKLIDKSFLLNEAEKRIKKIKKIYPKIDFRNKKILEIGCAKGEILFLLKRDYLADVTGIESSQSESKEGKKLFNINIKNCAFEALNSKDKYDVVLCYHTLEHVDDPKKFLMKIRNILAENGTAYLEVPNIMWPSFGTDLNTFLYDEHLQTFSISNLYSLIERCNLKVVEYDDETFLRIIIKKTGKSHPKPISIDSNKILDNLTNYKKNYSVLNRIKNKSLFFIGVMEAIYFKILDVIR